MPWQYMAANSSALPARLPSRGLAAEQKLQAVLHGLAVLARQVRFAGAEKREQGQAGDAGIGLCPGAAAIVAEGLGFAAGAVGVGVPAAVAALCASQPVESRGDGGFRLRRSRRRAAPPCSRSAATRACSGSGTSWPSPSRRGAGRLVATTN